MWHVNFKRIQTYQLRIIIAIYFVVVTFLAGRYLWRGDIFFHTDIARDFLLVDEIVQTKNLTLLGPRSGGIQGIFHGPLWLYMMVPVFLVSGGNPVGVGVYWLFLVAIYNAVVYIVTQKVFSPRVGLLTVIVTASQSIYLPYNLLNPFGAYLLAPIIFYCIYSFLKLKKPFWGYLSLFTLGLSFQFQMAFSAPLLVVVLGLYFHKSLISSLKILGGMILSLITPLLTFLLFDIRHDWLQTRSLLHYIRTDAGQSRDLLTFFKERFLLFSTKGLSLGPEVEILSYVGLILCLLISYGYVSKKISYRIRSILGLIGILYVCYWFVAFGFHGGIPQYYYGAFLPLITMGLIGGASEIFSKKIVTGIVAMIVLLNLSPVIASYSQIDEFVGKSKFSWQFYKSLSSDILERQHDPTLGYFAYTPDQYGYQVKYAMQFAKKASSVTIYDFKKQPLTALVYEPPPEDKPYLDGVWWKDEQVRIEALPTSQKLYENGYRLEFYDLSEDQLKIPTDPNLITSMVLR